MCISNNVCIVNSRIGENPNGLFTCHIARGESVVDYFIVSLELLLNISNFHVKSQTALSDHSRIVLKLNWQSTVISTCEVAQREIRRRLQTYLSKLDTRPRGRKHK